MDCAHRVRASGIRKARSTEGLTPLRHVWGLSGAGSGAGAAWRSRAWGPLKTPSPKQLVPGQGGLEAGTASQSADLGPRPTAWLLSSVVPQGARCLRTPGPPAPWVLPPGDTGPVPISLTVGNGSASDREELPGCSAQGTCSMEQNSFLGRHGRLSNVSRRALI